MGSAVLGGSAGIAFLVGIVTNYVTAELPEWAENTSWCGRCSGRWLWCRSGCSSGSGAWPPGRGTTVCGLCRWGGARQGALDEPA